MQIQILKLRCVFYQSEKHNNILSPAALKIFVEMRLTLRHTKPGKFVLKVRLV